MEYFDYEGNQKSRDELTEWLKARFSIFPQPSYEPNILEIHPGDRVLHDEELIIVVHNKLHGDC